MQFLGNIFDGRGPTPFANIERKPLGVERIIGKKVEPLLFHVLALPTPDASNLQFQIDAPVATGKIADTSHLAVLEALRRLTADWTDCFF